MSQSQLPEELGWEFTAPGKTIVWSVKWAQDMFSVHHLTKGDSCVNPTASSEERRKEIGQLPFAVVCFEVNRAVCILAALVLRLS